MPSVQPKAAVATNRSVSPRSYKWWVVGMLWFICFLNYADRQTIFSVFPKLKEEFGFDKVQLGLIGSAFMWLYAGGAPFAGFLADRFRRKDLILGGCVFWSLITMLTGGCNRLWHFVTVRALEGIGETFYFPASTSLVSDYHGKTRSRALGIHNSGVYIGTIAGGWLGAWFAETMGWRVGFYFFGGAGIVLALVLYRFLREPQRGTSDSDADIAQRSAGATPSPPLEERAGERRSLSASPSAPTPLAVNEIRRAILSKPVAWLLLGGFMCANFVATVFLAWTPTFLVEKFQFRLTSAGLSGSAFIHLASAVSVFFGGWLADKWSQRNAGGRMLVQALGLLVGSVFVFQVGASPSATVVLGMMACFGLCKGIYDANIFASIFDVVDARARATAAGIMNTVGWGGGALGPLAVGFFAKYGSGATEMENMSRAIAWCSVVYLAGAALLFTAAVLYRRQNTPAVQPT